MNRVFLLILCLYSCSGSTGDNVDAMSEYDCKNTLSIIQADSTLPSISFDLNDSKDQVLEKVRSVFPDNYRSYLYFKWNNKDHQSIRLTYLDEATCSGDIINTRININNRGFIMLDDYSVTDDLEQISSAISEGLLKNYKEQERPGNIVLVWQDSTQIKLIEQAIDQAIEGYVVAAKVVSKSLTNKELCDLNISEIEELKKEFPFTLILNLTLKNVPPPPLPPDIK